MNFYEQHRVLKAMAADLLNSKIGCGTESLVNTAALVVLVEAIEQLPDAPQYTVDTSALFQQVQDANETR